MSAKEAMSTRAGQDPRILIAAQDDDRTTALIAEIVIQLQPQITHVASVEDARRAIKATRPTLIIADQYLDDGYGLDIIPRDGSLRTPVVLIQEHVETDRMIEAMRLGVADVFEQPIDPDEVIDAIQRLHKREMMRQRDERRAKRLRRMSSKLIRDRRDLRRRVDVICNDIVVAYRQLAEKVVASPVWTPNDDGTPRRRPARDAH